MDTISRIGRNDNVSADRNRYARRVADALIRVLQGIERARERRALMALDDRLLKDIGLSRADAVREWSKPPWRV